ncbi:methyl-accepting chemotaxis protein [Fulvimarina endophytica]|uniref:Methyl-accepting chemotaxis protein n=2 Tax=Fulvimarina endophytica TaxID=2293836 RepID=A0A371X3K0_9HYPH|nr:methyl-accepting chemotaxis protein [Fulvimarina endophytica]
MQELVQQATQMRIRLLEATLAAMDEIVDRENGQVSQERTEIMSHGIQVSVSLVPSIEQLATRLDRSELADGLEAKLAKLESALLETLPRLVRTRADASAFGAIDDVIDSEAGEISENLDHLVEAAFVRLDTRAEEASRNSTFATYLQLGISLFALVLIAAIASLIGRSIVKSLGRVETAMSKLAGGQLDTPIEETDRKDEIGSMARALEVFKAASVERIRLVEENAKARASESLAKERQAALDNAKAEDLRTFVATVEVGFDRLSEGDLTVRMQDRVAEEFEPIRSKFNDSVAALENAIGHVVTSISSIRNGLSEINTASDDLSRRTEQQAASIEETVAALNEVTTAVNNTANDAGKAQKVAMVARERAVTGGDVVGRAVIAMGQIEESSQKINLIISVIDEIAFQTNLLALNAGVEAARAGEAGRGFAVVAQEVRGLAQRSADAAKEIKMLLSVSREQVGSGVELVTASGKSLEGIVAEVTTMAELISTIAASAGQQAISLREVSQAADQMDKVTQQNAAMVEQATAASLTLSTETDELARTMSQFRTEAQNGSATREAARKPVRSERTTTQLRTVGTGGAAFAPERGADDWEDF